MSHRIFTISVGILTFVLIALSVANASNRAANPPESAQAIEIISQPDNIAQNEKEETSQKAGIGRDSAEHSEEMNQP
ncbi:MAG: hypothetical protein FWH56_00040 [Betaproteobacteria bacterium]|nr:hypothetical protein [Betaproteobacteria bacterium]